jgi:hypothetical protein
VTRKSTTEGRAWAITAAISISENQYSHLTAIANSNAVEGGESKDKDHVGSLRHPHSRPEDGSGQISRKSAARDPTNACKTRRRTQPVFNRFGNRKGHESASVSSLLGQTQLFTSSCNERLNGMDWCEIGGIALTILILSGMVIIWWSTREGS